MLVQTLFCPKNAFHLFSELLSISLLCFAQREQRLVPFIPVLPTGQPVQRLGRLMRCVEVLCGSQQLLVLFWELWMGFFNL